VTRTLYGPGSHHQNMCIDIFFFVIYNSRFTVRIVIGNLQNLGRCIFKIWAETK